MNYGCPWGNMVEKQKCRRTENLMEPKAGAQGDHLNVHSPKIGSWNFLRLITEFADCTPFIEIYNSPSPRPQQPQGNPRILGHFPEAFVSAFPHPPAPSSLGTQGSSPLRRGKGPVGAEPSWVLLKGSACLHCCHPIRALWPLSRHFLLPTHGPIFSAGV